MKYNILTEVIYKDIDGNEIPTYIKDIDEVNQKYILDYDLEKVSEDQIELNTLSNFYVSLSMLSNQKIKDYSRNYLIDRVVTILNRNIDDEEVTAIRYMESIGIKVSSAKLFTDQGEDKSIEKLNKLIKFINDRITLKHFNEAVAIDLLLPMARYKLDPILI